MLSIYGAETSRTLDGKNPNRWVQEQIISVEETVRAYSVDSAYVEFSEKAKGTIAVGKLADLGDLVAPYFQDRSERDRESKGRDDDHGWTSAL